MPAIESKLAFQLANFFLTLSNTKLKSCLCFPGCFKGKPRYLPRLVVELNPMISMSASLWSWSTLGEKKTWDLASLTFCLDLAQKSWSTELIVA